MNELAVVESKKQGLVGVDPKTILERFLADETGQQIAKSYGVTRAALSLHMLKHAETEWKDAQVAKALRRKEEAEELMETAADALELTRAREKLRSAQWDLERVCRRIYGQDAPPSSASVHISLNIGGEPATTQRTIDVTPENDSQK